MTRRKTKRALTVSIGAFMLASSVLPLTPQGVNTVHAETLSGVMKFDFGTQSSPVMSGYHQVHDGLLYTPELGYGLDKSVISRLRTGSDDLYNDFILGTDYTFMVDVPDGEYDVTVYSGDLLTGTSTTKTTVSLEGETKGTIQTKQAVAEETFHTTVTDGQLTVGITGVGAGGYVNGMVIEQVTQEPPAAPQGLAVSSVSASENESAVSLQWSNVPDAASYNVYRATFGSEEYTKLGSTDAAAYTDATAVFNNRYSYQVSAVNAAGLESAFSDAVTVEVKPPSEAPAAPADVSIIHIAEDEVSLSWTAVNYAASYTIFRSDEENGDYVEIGTTDSTNYTDTTADTSTAWYYKVKAVNVSGLSLFSSAARSTPYSAPQPLPEGTPIKFDFGSGAVADGYIGVASTTAYNEQLQYGFTDPSKVSAEDRGERTR
ncbi:fibronectin type III domain-containing protein [Paenibacillus hexagrammi]|uniref:Fibronectin type-III domain-containing protein n=1 Tax=Paenibacillus hexagrammi TaxID=2908839 RepID=A0ABY3SC24_9BACL|nr:hypothetical protein [Paenibacillus sp. YPD9-1]UJF31549.1 hypothetical protein L0M14_17230 [Paenibacillus sp. YPD9-1]